MDWAYEHTGNLRKKSDEIEKGPAKIYISEYLENISDQDYQVGYWTILKNISLAYCLNPFGIILDKYKIKNTIFLDPFCGSGITPLKDPVTIKTSWTIGSPLISTMMTDYPFKHYYFGDISNKSIGTLKNIFTSYNDFGLDVTIKLIDANQLIKLVSQRIKNQYVFAYIDQSGFQLNWNSLLLLLNIKKFDILLNFQTRQVDRIGEEKRKEFFGPAFESIQRCSDCDDILNQYISHICERDVFVTNIKIGKDRSNQFYYHLLHISRKDTYKRIVDDLKLKIESFDGKSMKMIWNDLIGYSKQQSLF